MRYINNSQELELCEVCHGIYPKSQMTDSHIFTKGAHPELADEPLNKVRMCWGTRENCHPRFENMTRKKKNKLIEEKLPGRIKALERLIKEKACFIPS